MCIDQRLGLRGSGFVSYQIFLFDVGVGSSDRLKIQRGVCEAIEFVVHTQRNEHPCV